MLLVTKADGSKLMIVRLQIPKQELSAPCHTDDLGRIFFDHDAVFVAEINSRSPAGLRPEVANLIHVQIKGHLLSGAHQREGDKFSHEVSPVRQMCPISVCPLAPNDTGNNKSRYARMIKAVHHKM